MSWLDGLEDDFGYRLPSPEGYNVAIAVHNAIHSSIPNSVEAPRLVYPIDWADGRTGALWVDDKGADLVLVDPPDAAVVKFLGSLDGGEYRETLSPGEGTHPDIERFFNHERLGTDGPLRLLVHPVPGNPRTPGYRDSRERTERLRDLYRDWATAPPHGRKPTLANGGRRVEP